MMVVWLPVAIAFVCAFLAGHAAATARDLRLKVEELQETVDELEDDLEAFQAWAEASRYSRSEDE
jgi:hypothetical protein